MHSGVGGLTLPPLSSPAAMRGLRRHLEGTHHGEEPEAHGRAGHLEAPRGRGQAGQGGGYRPGQQDGVPEVNFKDPVGRGLRPNNGKLSVFGVWVECSLATRGSSTVRFVSTVHSQTRRMSSCSSPLLAAATRSSTYSSLASFP